MMRMTQGWTRLRTAVIALGLVACTSTGAKADSILGYSTAGSIDTTLTADGVTGTNVISFVPITNAQVDATSNIPLGYFQVAALPSGQSTTYDNTPFSITFVPSSLNGTALASPGSVEVTGVLNGVVTGSTQSGVLATFDTLSNGSFQLAGASSTLSIPQSGAALVPSSAGNGTTTVEGMIVTNGTPEVPAPEPSTIALFLSTVGGLGLRKYVLSRRQRSQA
jgi:hypothetical protein